MTEDEIRIDREIPVCFPSEMEEGMAPEERVKCLPKPLISWYRKEKRNLPWRKEATAYHVWVSEIMLQQTRVEAVKPFYARFLAAFPEIEDLARAPEEKLLKLWEGLGYYNRVRNIPAVLCAVAMVAAAVEEAPSELAGASLTVSPSVSDGCALVAAVSGGSVACIALI